MHVSMSATHWTTLYYQDEQPLEYFFDNPKILQQYHQDSVTLYILGCPQLHLFDLFVVNVTQKDCKGLCQALWVALYKADWNGDLQYEVKYGSSIVKVKQIYKYSGMTSLNIIRHFVPEPNF